MRQKNRRGTDKVIHVVFGPGGGRVESRPHRPPEGGTIKAALELPDAREPITDMFSGSEVARLLGFSTARLRTLDRAGVVSPSGRRRGRRAYTFSDLIALRAAQGLLARRVRLRDVTRAVAALQRSLPKVTRPLAELRIVSDGQRVVVRSQEGSLRAAHRADAARPRGQEPARRRRARVTPRPRAKSARAPPTASTCARASSTKTPRP